MENNKLLCNMSNTSTWKEVLDVLVAHHESDDIEAALSSLSSLTGKTIRYIVDTDCINYYAEEIDEYCDEVYDTHTLVVNNNTVCVKRIPHDDNIGLYPDWYSLYCSD